MVASEECEMLRDIGCGTVEAEDVAVSRSTDKWFEFANEIVKV